MNSDGDTTQHQLTQTLGRYQLRQRIGRGGMGDVWLADDPRLRRQVAIKTLPTHSQQDREFALRFEREAQAAAALNHPHILPVHDYGVHSLPNGQAITYIVMPYVSGGSLAQHISSHVANRTGMPPQQALIFLAQAAEAIDYAHTQGIIHRDIKPGNMLLRSDDWLMLADFGIARILSSTEQLTQTGVGFGTPEYMAPEQAQGKAEPSSDNYSLAVIAYQLLTGRLPFKADTGYATTIQHMMLPPPSPRQFNPSLSPACEQVLLYGLAKQPAQRPPTARAFITALQQTITSTLYEATIIPAQLPQTEGRQLVTDKRATEMHPPLPATEVMNARSLPMDKGITRRQLMIGGGVALVLVGGSLVAWTLASHHTAQSTNQSSTTGQQATSTPAKLDPNAPVLTLLGHNKPVGSFAWSPTAPILASAGSNSDGYVYLWDVAALYQQPLQSPQYKAQKQFSGSSNLILAWSAKNNVLAIGNAAVEMGSAQVSVYRGDLAGPASGYPGYNSTPPLQVNGLLNGLAWTEDDYLLCTTTPQIGQNDALVVWNGLHQVGIIQLAYQLYTSSTLSIGWIAPSPHDIHTVALGCLDGIHLEALTITNTTATAKVQTSLSLSSPDGFDNEVGGLTWDAGGQYLAAIAAAFTNPMIVNVWDFTDHQRAFAHTLPDQTTSLTTLAWSPVPASPFFAGGAKNGQVFIWNYGSAPPVRVLHGLNAEITALSWSSDGHWLAAGYNDTNASILVWKI